MVFLLEHCKVSLAASALHPVPPLTLLRIIQISSQNKLNGHFFSPLPSEYSRKHFPCIRLIFSFTRSFRPGVERYLFLWLPCQHRQTHNHNFYCKPVSSAMNDSCKPRASFNACNRLAPAPLTLLLLPVSIQLTLLYGTIYQNRVSGMENRPQLPTRRFRATQSCEHSKASSFLPNVRTYLKAIRACSLLRYRRKNYCSKNGPCCAALTPALFSANGEKTEKSARLSHKTQKTCQDSRVFLTNQQSLLTAAGCPLLLLLYFEPFPPILQDMNLLSHRPRLLCCTGQYHARAHDRNHADNQKAYFLVSKVPRYR